jgi:hypothetical protein
MDWGNPQRTSVNIFDFSVDIRERKKKTLPENKIFTSWANLLRQYSLFEEQVRHLWTVKWINGRVEAWVCGRSLAGSTGSNSVGVMDVGPLCLVRVVQVAASATSWSLVQRSPTECDASLCVSNCALTWSPNKEVTKAPGGLLRHTIKLHKHVS